MTWATNGSSSISQRVSSRSLGGSGLGLGIIVGIVISKKMFDRRPNMISRTKANNRAIFASDMSVLEPVSRYGAYQIHSTSLSLTVIARSPCDEAIQGRVMRPLDCFASLAITG
jgi:hypothetical protein